jgi:Flp pilus assembly protein TadB
MRYLIAALIGGSTYYLVATLRGASRWRLRALGIAARHTISGNSNKGLSPSVVCAAVGCIVFVVAPSLFSLVVGVVIAMAGPRLLARLESRNDREFRQRCERDLPLALDLAAACLVGGAPVTTAMAEVANAMGGPLAQQLDEVIKQLQLGADPVLTWRTLGPGEELQRVGQALARSSRAGSVSAQALQSMARESRQRSRLEGQAKARQVSVRTAGPLGLCFLPAFVLLAIVPAVYGAVVPLLG